MVSRVSLMRKRRGLKPARGRAALPRAPEARQQLNLPVIENPGHLFVGGTEEPSPDRAPVVREAVFGHRHAILQARLPETAGCAVYVDDKIVEAETAGEVRPAPPSTWRRQIRVAEQRGPYRRPAAIRSKRPRPEARLTPRGARPAQPRTHRRQPAGCRRSPARVRRRRPRRCSGPRRRNRIAPVPRRLHGRGSRIRCLRETRKSSSLGRVTALRSLQYAISEVQMPKCP